MQEGPPLRRAFLRLDAVVVAVYTAFLRQLFAEMLASLLQRFLPDQLLTKGSHTPRTRIAVGLGCVLCHIPIDCALCLGIVEID